MRANWEVQSSITYGGSKIILILCTFFSDTGFSPAHFRKISTSFFVYCSDSINIVLPLRVGAYEVAGKTCYGCVSLFSVVVMRHSTLPFPFAEAMDNMKPVLVPNYFSQFHKWQARKRRFAQHSLPTQSAHYDCVEMTENNLCALNQISKCNIAPENLEISRAKITMYTKHFRQAINAAICRVKYQSEQRHCGFGDDSSMDAHHTSGTTRDSTVAASQCRTLAKGGSITSNDETFEFKKGTKQR